MTNVITKESAIQLIKSSNGKIFTVQFVKKDGSVRKLNCRTGVSKYVNGTGLKYDPSEHDLLTVFDVRKKDYRMINTETLQSVTIQGASYSVV